MPAPGFSKILRTALILGAAAAGLGATPAAAAPWVRSYVIEWFQPAFFYGGKAEDQQGPGSDCPKGTTPSNGYVRMMTTKWRTAKQVEYYLDPEHRPELQRGIRFRGPNYENIWEEPYLAPDLGMAPVAGTIAYGFDLDGDAKTGGFATPDGVAGIDNAYYRAAGCWLSYRGKTYETQRGLGTDDKMRNGQFTIIMVISGDKDPMNDDDAKIGFYDTKDHITKDANGAVAFDATFTIKPDDNLSSVTPVTIKNGLIETKGPSEIKMRDESHFPNMPPQLALSRGQIKFQVQPDGKVTGFLGGYRNWKVYYKKQAVDGRDVEMNTWIDMPSYYWALERNADGGPLDPKTHKHTMISTAYRLDAAPAFVLEPDGKTVVASARMFEPDAKAVALAKNAASDSVAPDYLSGK